MILFFMVLNVDFIYFVGRPLGRQCDGLNPNLHSDKNIKENSTTTTTCYNRAVFLLRVIHYFNWYNYKKLFK